MDGLNQAKLLLVSADALPEVFRRVVEAKQYYEDRPNITKTAQIHMLTIPNDTVWAEYQSYLDE